VRVRPGRRDEARRRHDPGRALRRTGRDRGRRGLPVLDRRRVHQRRHAPRRRRSGPGPAELMATGRRTDWSRIARPSLAGIEPYDPGETRDEVKDRLGLADLVPLNWNEDLFGPPQHVLDAAVAEVARAPLYPERAYGDFRAAVADWIEVPPACVVPAHGAQALISAVTQVFVDAGTPVVIPQPTYGLYAQLAAAGGGVVHRVPTDGLALDLEAIAAAAETHAARLVWLCDPNNPTGLLIDRAEWAAFLERLPEGCAAIVDEAYIDFSDPEVRVRREQDVLDGRPVVCIRSFSKVFGLAGLRLGYAVCDPAVAALLNVVQEPFNVNRVALAAGRAAVETPGLADRRRAGVRAPPPQGPARAQRRQRRPARLRPLHDRARAGHARRGQGAGRRARDTVIRDLETVVGNGLCSGCGLCESVAGSDRVRMTMTPIGQLRPKVSGPLPEPVLAEALVVCPGVEVRGPKAEPGVAVHPVWGPIASLARGWSTDPGVRHRSSAGGVLSALALYLLERDEADAVLHVRADLPDRPLETVAQISRTRADVLAGAQSRYGPAAPLVHVHRLLEEGARFAMVAKPCDISAVRALQRRDARAREQIVATLTSYCGGVPSLLMAEKIVRSHGVEPDEVIGFTFRGDGWPGPMRTTARDGRTFDVTYDEAWYDPTVPLTYDMQFRCKICPDAIGEMADLSCPDGWVLRD